jgi:hypothetical protein
MTQADFDKLPALLSAYQVILVLGCNEKTLRKIRESKPDIAVMVRGMQRHRYLKAKVAELARLR